MEITANIEKVALKKFKNIHIVEIRSGKSDFDAINDALNRVKNEIEKMVKINSQNEKKTEVILDITGGTKVNSAMSSLILNEYAEENDSIRFYQCYVSIENKKIYQSGYENCVYKLSDIASKTEVKKDNLLDLHGGEEYKSNKNLELIDKIIVNDFTLIFIVTSKKIM